MLDEHANAQLSIVSLDIVKCAGLDTLYTRAGEFRTLTFCKIQSVWSGIVLGPESLRSTYGIRPRCLDPEQSISQSPSYVLPVRVETYFIMGAGLVTPPLPPSPSCESDEQLWPYTRSGAAAYPVGSTVTVEGVSIAVDCIPPGMSKVHLQKRMTSPILTRNGLAAIRPIVSSRRARHAQ